MDDFIDLPLLLLGMVFAHLIGSWMQLGGS
jgi:hypothetical protein